MSWMAKTKGKSPVEPMKKRIPENPKFKNIKPIVCTGQTARTQLPQRIKDFQKYQRQDEIFKRIRLSTFIALMIEAAKDKFNSQNSNEIFVVDQSTIKDESASLNSILNGIGEFDLKQQRASSSLGNKTMAPIQTSTSQLPPYLLLDVRDPVVFEDFHIVTAKSYPSAMLCRTCNYESKDLLLYKNSPLFIIVIYDDDESISSRVATTLTQRGYDNIFILTGGLKQATSKFKDGLIVYKNSANSNTTKVDVLNDKSDEQLTPTRVEILESQLNRIVTSFQNCNDQSIAIQSRASTACTRRSYTMKPSLHGKIKPWK